MSAPKFKVGDRVKFNDVEGRACVGLINSFYQYDCDNWRYALEGNGVLSWHESHLSLDVPEPKKYAAGLEARLGEEIIKQHRAVIDLSNRLAEEIGGRARERIAKEAAEKGIDGYVAELWEVKRKLKIADESLGRAFVQFPKDIAAERQSKEAALADSERLLKDKILLNDKLMSAAHEVYIERTAKEAAQKELAKANDSLHFQRMELRKAMEDRSVEWLANEATKKELADVRQDLADLRKDLADLRVISRRLAL